MTISSLLLGGARASEQMPLNVAGETADPASAMGALVRAMQGGDLVGAQKAYQGLQDQLPAPMAGDKMDAEANAQLNQIGAALRSEDLAGAGRALDVLIRKADAALSTAPGAVERSGNLFEHPALIDRPSRSEEPEAPLRALQATKSHRRNLPKLHEKVCRLSVISTLGWPPITSPKDLAQCRRNRQPCERMERTSGVR